MIHPMFEFEYNSRVAVHNEDVNRLERAEDMLGIQYDNLDTLSEDYQAAPNERPAIVAYMKDCVDDINKLRSFVRSEELRLERQELEFGLSS